jgi:hypothetical protein
MGGGVYQNGGWIPKTNPAAQAAGAGTGTGTTAQTNTLSWTPSQAPAFTAPKWQGAGAAPTLNAPAAFQAPDANAMTLDPGYQFRLKQGQQALENSASARGTLRGGAHLQALTGFAQGLASEEYGKAYARARDVYDANVARENAVYGAKRDAYNADASERQAAFNANFRGAEAEYAPQNAYWQASNLAGQRNAELNFQRAFDRDVYDRDSAFREAQAERDNAFRRWSTGLDEGYRRDVFEDDKRRFLVNSGRD